MAIRYIEEPLPAVSTFPFDITHWGGVNQIEAGQYDYEMSDCKNMSSDNFPYASPRKARRKLVDEMDIKRIYKVEEDKVYFIGADDKLYYAEDGIANTVTYINDDEAEDTITMPNCLCINNYDKCTIFYPTMRYIDKDSTPKYMNYPIEFSKIPSYNNWLVYSREFDAYESWFVSAGPYYVDEVKVKQIGIHMRLPEADSYKYPHAYPNNDAASAKYTPKIRVKIYNSKGDIKSYSVADDKGNKKEYKYIEVQANISGRYNEYYINIPDGIALEEGDYIMLEFGLYFDIGFLDYTDDIVKKNIKYGRAAEWYIGENEYNENGFVGALDYGVIYNNRIVGVKGCNIRASALGDFSNFWEYADEAGNPSATGAYATDVGSAGNFTGICAYNNVLLLFKRDIVYEMYGSMPYSITELCSTGCIDNDSICEIDGVLYWASPKGIVRYSGGVPCVISHNINIDTSGNCKAGTDGRKYYVYDGKLLYVYDTVYGVWHIEDDVNVKMFYNDLINLYMVCDDGIYLLNAGEEDVEWEFTTKDYTFSSAERKNLSKLWIRAQMSRLSKLEVYVRQDGGEWTRTAVKTAERDEMFDFKLRIKKCDSFAIKFKGKGDVRILDIHGKVTVGTSKHRSGASLNVYRR